MDSVRQQKYSRLIQKELGDLFLKEGKAWFGNQFVTITGVKVTPDLALARVRVSIFKNPKPADVIRSLNQNMHDIRRHLGARIGKQARVVPGLEFFLDDSLDYAEKIDTLFKGIVIPPEDKPEDE